MFISLLATCYYCFCFCHFVFLLQFFFFFCNDQTDCQRKTNGELENKEKHNTCQTTLLTNLPISVRIKFHNLIDYGFLSSIVSAWCVYLSLSLPSCLCVCHDVSLNKRSIDRLSLPAGFAMTHIIMNMERNDRQSLPDRKSAPNSISLIEMTVSESVKWFH